MTENVGVLGPKGTFTEQAARKLYPDARLDYMDDVEEVFEYVKAGKGLGVVAIENSLEGSVAKNLELLMEYDVKICGEATLDINLCLMKGKETREIKSILSHPHALAQCRKTLKRKYPKAKIQDTESTAKAMMEAAKAKDAAAIGLKDAAKTYGLETVEENLQDDASQTRFIAVGRKECFGGKTSIIFATKDEPGALYGILKIFSDARINLTKIESRPSRKKLGEYVFHVDFENNGLDKKGVQDLLAKVKEKTTYFKSLGSY